MHARTHAYADFDTTLARIESHREDEASLQEQLATLNVRISVHMPVHTHAHVHVRTHEQDPFATPSAKKAARRVAPSDMPLENSDKPPSKLKRCDT